VVFVIEIIVFSVEYKLYVWKLI